MTNFEFNNGVPNAPNNPSVDQPQMLINTVSEEGIWTQDHIGYNSNNGGSHLQNSYTAFSAGTVLSGTNPNQASTAFPAAGKDNSTYAQYYFENALNPSPPYALSAIKAFGNFIISSGSGTPPLINQMNVVSVTGPTGVGGNLYTVTLQPNTLSSTNALVFCFLNSPTNTFELSYSFTNKNVIVFSTNPAAGPFIFNFLILQI